jgi:thiamine biosynthesis lipoprotein
VTRDAYTRAITTMDTVVTIEVRGCGSDLAADHPVAAAVDRAIGWFDAVEAACTRFDPASELMQLTSHIGVAVPVGPLLFEAARFAIAVADETAGAFDPTVGHELESRGFNRHYRTGRVVRTAITPPSSVSYRDVHVDEDARTITLRAPLILDLGGVAKGLAIDAAARELMPFQHFAIDAGGDLYLASLKADGAPWSVGIRHPRRDGAIIETVSVTNAAVCTSGDYERGKPNVPGAGHIVDPRTTATRAAPPSGSNDRVASATVVAPTAMAADALSTAAFVLGPLAGLDLLVRQAVDGVIYSDALERFATPGFPRG